MLLKAVILIAGPQKGTRFRPLSLDAVKPLFPVGGVSTIEHHVEACAAVPEIKEILILGFYPSADICPFVEEMSNKYTINIRYLQEHEALGTAGGIYHFHDQIRSGNPDAFFLLNGDVCADFPLVDLLRFHQESSLVTIMATEATKQQSLNFGCIVEDKETHALLHYVEKPKTYVSTLINCGVYVFSTRIFANLHKAFLDKSFGFYDCLNQSQSGRKDYFCLEKDILTSLGGQELARVYQTNNWWSQIKTAGSAIYANRSYLKLYEKSHPERLAVKDTNGPEIIGNVFIHESAEVHPSAVIGPNVSIGPNVKISSGVRIRESIILGNSFIGDHTLVLYSVVGWNSNVGSWCRVEGTPNDPNPNKPYAKMENSPLFSEEGKLNPSITILGGNVNMSTGIILLNSIVLPHKLIEQNYKNEIIL